MSDTKGVDATPALGVSMNLQFAAGRQVVFQTHVPQDTTESEMNALLDLMNACGDRAEAFYAQDQARRQLEVEENALVNIVRRLSEVETNIQLKNVADGRRNPRISASDEMAKKQALDSVEEGKRRVATCRKHLQDLIEKAGNRDGASSPANR